MTSSEQYSISSTSTSHSIKMPSTWLPSQKTIRMQNSWTSDLRHDSTSTSLEQDAKHLAAKSDDEQENSILFLVALGRWASGRLRPHLRAKAVRRVLFCFYYYSHFQTWDFLSFLWKEGDYFEVSHKSGALGRLRSTRQAGELDVIWRSNSQLFGDYYVLRSRFHICLDI